MTESSAALLILLASASYLGRGPAIQKSMDAYLRYSGADNMLDKKLNEYQQSVPEDAKIYLGAGFYLTKSIIDRKITFTYHFP
jgi:hypothetical protein